VTLRAPTAQDIEDSLSLGNGFRVSVISAMIPAPPLGVQRVTDVSDRGRFIDVSNAGYGFAGWFGLDVKGCREFDDGSPVGRTRWNVTSGEVS